MVDPVITAGGFTYERKEISAWFARGKRTDPLTNEELDSTDLIPNRALKSQISDWKDAVARGNVGKTKDQESTPPSVESSGPPGSPGGPVEGKFNVRANAVVVTGLPPEVTVDNFESMFRRYGSIEQSSIGTSNSGTCFGYLRFTDEAAALALEKDSKSGGVRYGEATLVCKLMRRRRPRSPSRIKGTIVALRDHFGFIKPKP